MAIGLEKQSRITIFPSSLSGSVKIPPSKSQTQRALVFALLGMGVSVIKKPLQSPDVEAMIRACRVLGAQINVSPESLEVCGVDGKISVNHDRIDAGNSGQVIRFIGAVAALSSQSVILTGDDSICSNRPVQPLLDGLLQLGAQAHSVKANGYAPIHVGGPLRGGRAVVDGADSQPVSGLLMAAAFAPDPVEIVVKNPGEKPWVGMTLSWLERLHIPYVAKDFAFYRLEGGSSYPGFSYTVPGDFSSAAFMLAASLVTGSPLTLTNLDLKDPQGDKKLLQVLVEMGAKLEMDEEIRVQGGDLSAMTIDVDDMIDTLPILAVLGCYAEGKTVLTGGKMARKKESDRISCIAKELSKMGARIEEAEAGLTIYHSQLHGAEVVSHNDHRIAMALAVAALGAKGATTIEGIECVQKSYPGFFDELHRLGAHVE